MRGDEARGGEEVGGGVCAELDECGAVRGAAIEERRLKGLGAVSGGCGEEAGVEHGGVAERVGGGVPAGEETPGLGEIVSTGRRGARDEGREREWGERQTYSDCSTIGATMVFGEPIDS